MSVNAVAAIEQVDHDWEIRPMILPRVGRGITSTALIGTGDHISFSGITGKVQRIVHQHVPADGRAPNSVAHILFAALRDDEIEVLRSHGFQDEGSDNGKDSEAQEAGVHSE